MHEAAHRIGFGRVLGNAGRSNASAADPVPPTQTAKTGFGWRAPVRCACTDATTACAASVARGERGRHVHHQDGVVAGIAEQGIACGGIARAVGIAGDIDRISSRPDRRQSRIEPRHRVG